MKTHRVIICGGRTELDYQVASGNIREIFTQLQIETAEIISGGARGADKVGELFAEENGIPLKRFLPDWGRYGRGAGLKRNLQMLEYAMGSENPIVIAFWNGESKGTGFTVENARQRNIPVYVIDCSEMIVEKNGN